MILVKRVLTSLTEIIDGWCGQRPCINSQAGVYTCLHKLQRGGLLLTRF